MQIADGDLHILIDDVRPLFRRQREPDDFHGACGGGNDDRIERLWRRAVIAEVERRLAVQVLYPVDPHVELERVQILQ